MPETTTDRPSSDDPVGVDEVDSTAIGTRPRPVWASVAKVLAWVILAGLALPAVLRILWVEVGPAAVIVSLVPWATMATVVVTVVLMILRWWAPAIAAMVLSIVGLSWLVPLYVAAPDPPQQRRVNVATVNTLYGHADAAQIVAMVAAHDVDVLSVQELTAVELRSLSSAGLDRVLPYHHAVTAGGAAGTGLWSREPLTDVVEPRTSVFAMIEATTTTRSGVLIRAVAAHPAAPDPLHTGVWRRDASALYDVMNQALAGRDVVLLAGDLNATLDHPSIRRLEGLGLVDAITAAGAGFHPTYPNDGEFFPLVAIDHVMARGLVARSVEAVSIDLSDHKALVTSMVG